MRIFIARGLVALAVGFLSSSVFAQKIGDGPVIENHVDQQQIDTRQMSLQEILIAGGALFRAKFNTFDGQGRPGTTGGGDPRVPGSAPSFIRTSAPDSNSCAGCHNDPFEGGGGDFVANVFVLAQALDPVTESVSSEFSNNRNTLGMFGAGAIEMLSREMTVELHAIRDQAIAEAQDSGNAVAKELWTKDVHFGSITANPDGTVDTTGIEGLDADLIIKPFHQKGVVTSLREFTNNAMNHHHGMQTVERFGEARTGSKDYDQDGVEDELSVGDVTATTLWQAVLGTPGQVIPNNAKVARAIIRGERLFGRIGCADCHTPELELNSPVFSEPNPFNPPGNLQVSEVVRPYTVDLTSQGAAPFLEKTRSGKAVVRAYTDLKRHNLCDDDYNHYCNEKVVQAGVPTNMFLTRKLWDVGNSAPYGHRGDLTTLTAAIYYHGGEARDSRDAFFSMEQSKQDEVIEFLKSLQVLPPGTKDLVVDENGQAKSKAALIKKMDRENLDSKGRSMRGRTEPR